LEFTISNSQSRWGCDTWLRMNIRFNEWCSKRAHTVLTSVLANLQDSAPVSIDPLTEQQIPVDDRQFDISKLGTIAESIALKMMFFMVTRAPT
jgi:hypothetical protein